MGKVQSKIKTMARAAPAHYDAKPASAEAPAQPKAPMRTNSLARGTLEQVSGHSDTFMRISETQIWKLTDPPERNMLEVLMCTPELRSLVPEYFQDVPLSHWEGRDPQVDSVCIELQDLTAGFGESPCVMDIKVGVRTFLEDEVSNPKLRPDLLKKMEKLDTMAPTADERANGGVTKLRYMQFREQMSTSSTLGFRLEGLKVTLPSGQRLEDGIPTKETLSRERSEEVTSITKALAASCEACSTPPYLCCLRRVLPVALALGSGGLTVRLRREGCWGSHCSNHRSLVLVSRGADSQVQPLVLTAVPGAAKSCRAHSLHRTRAAGAARKTTHCASLARPGGFVSSAHFHSARSHIEETVPATASINQRHAVEFWALSSPPVHQHVLALCPRCGQNEGWHLDDRL